ncbi:MAG: hypothetical protein KGL39_30105 [Patescibacteria group bacterium]|nr:hypothetical protein [Patescibacteria group bacterium]
MDELISGKTNREAVKEKAIAVIYRPYDPLVSHLYEQHDSHMITISMRVLSLKYGCKRNKVRGQKTAWYGQELPELPETYITDIDADALVLLSLMLSLPEYTKNVSYRRAKDMTMRSTRLVEAAMPREQKNAVVRKALQTYALVATRNDELQKLYGFEDLQRDVRNAVTLSIPELFPPLRGIVAAYII